MSMETLSETRIFKYQFETAIKRDVDAVWSLMTDGINDWWMTDFRALGEGSVMSLRAEMGGGLVESGKTGESLEWYRVQMCMPGKSIYLVGYMAPDWGGPTVSMLKLALEPKDGASLLTVSDALMGNITESSIKSAQSGWETMFRDGLKAHAEA
jgi:uncharacterized protein YndB with AHSA1/START domain